MNADNFLRRMDRACWESLTEDQKREYCSEAKFLRGVYHMTPSQAVSIVRRMIRVGSWK